MKVTKLKDGENHLDTAIVRINYVPIHIKTRFIVGDRYQFAVHYASGQQRNEEGCLQHN